MMCCVSYQRFISISERNEPGWHPAAVFMEEKMSGHNGRGNAYEERHKSTRKRKGKRS